MDQGVQSDRFVRQSGMDKEGVGGGIGSTS